MYKVQSSLRFGISRRQVATLILFKYFNEFFDSFMSVDECSGIPDSTIFGWLSRKRDLTNPDVPLMRRGYELGALDLAARLDEIADLATGEVLGRLSSREASIISLSHLLRAAEVGVDKSQLLRGQPTSITESIERHELTIILQSSLRDAIDITPE